MVLLHVKTADDSNQFLFETSTKETVKNIVAAVTSIHLTRLQALKTAEAAEALATHGPLRPEETRGLTEEVRNTKKGKDTNQCSFKQKRWGATCVLGNQGHSSGLAVELRYQVAKLSNLDVYPDGPPTNPDPHFYRTGVPPPKEVADVMIKTCKEVQENLSRKKVDLREPLTLEQAKESLNLLKGAIQIAYPAYHGLPTWEPARLLLEGKESNAGSEISETITAANACLWWTGKQLQQEEILAKYLGSNEKTKTIVRLQPKHAGPPVREPRMDPETHKAVVAYCHKKRQEEKAFQEDDDDSYLYSAWADPKGLKNALTGVGEEIRWRA